MKILTISAYYPPFSYGGYENRVRDVMEELVSRGHQIRVLTTKPEKALEVTPIKFPYPVVRRLHGTRRVLDWADRLTTKSSTNRLGVVLVFLRQVWHNLHDLRLIDHAILTFQPDIVYLGNILPLSASILPFFASIPQPLVLDDGGKTLELSHEDHGLWYRFLEEFLPSSTLLRLLKKIFTSLITTISSGRLRNSWVWPDKINAIFNSHFSHKSFLASAIPFSNSRVIHSGLDLRQFSFDRKKDPQQPLCIIVPGRIEPIKGQLDAVRLSALLRQEGVRHLMIIVGDRWNREYASQVEEQVRKLDLGELVKFMPMQEKDALIELYHQSDICFFPSYQRAGFSRIPLEAMACGCVVVSCGNEGSDEIIRDGDNGFLFPSEAITEVNAKVVDFDNNAALMHQVANSARKTVEKNHSMSFYVDQIEAFLYELK